MLVLSSPNVGDAPSIGPVYNVKAAVHNVNGGVYKVNEKSLSTLDMCVNNTHAPNAGVTWQKHLRCLAPTLAIIQLRQRCATGAIAICDWSLPTVVRARREVLRF